MHNHHHYRYDYDHHDHHYLCTVVVFSKGIDNNFKNKNNVDQNAVYRYYEAGVPSGAPGIAIKTEACLLTLEPLRKATQMANSKPRASLRHLESKFGQILKGKK